MQFAIILPYSTYKYKWLPIGLASSTNVISEIPSLVSDLTYAYTYLKNLLYSMSGIFENHIDELKLLLHQLQTASLQVNTNKSF